MIRLILTRLALFVPTLLAASIILFIAINVVPGSAARSALGVDATPQAIMRFEAQNGLDRPLHVQYAEWFGKAVTRRFRKSFQNRVDVGPEILKRLACHVGVGAVGLHRCESHSRAIGRDSRLSPCEGLADTVITSFRDHSRGSSEFLARYAFGAGVFAQASMASCRQAGTRLSYRIR